MIGRPLHIGGRARFQRTLSVEEAHGMGRRALLLPDLGLPAGVPRAGATGEQRGVKVAGMHWGGSKKDPAGWAGELPFGCGGSIVAR